jgi:tetratricopeptide (TPR) repeat protein
MQHRTVPLILTTVLLLLPSGLRAESTPWTQAAEEVRATEADIAKAGIQGIQPHIENLEKTLIEGAMSFPPPRAADGRETMLVDGQVETLAALVHAASAKRNAVAVFNPYPSAAFYLALYYNEVHKPDEALRAIDAGMKLSTAEGLEFGAHMTVLYGEQAAAFEQLKRFQDAFDVCDKGSKLASAGKMDRARMYRCRAFALSELDRLDEAQQSLEESLKLEPGNPIATRELAYIARLRAGSQRTPVEQVLTPRSPEPQNSPDPPPKDRDKPI